MSILHKDHTTEESEIRFKFLSDSVLKAEPFWIWECGFWIGRIPRRVVSRSIRSPKSAIPNGLMIGSGTKLGASVTVLVRDKSPNPKRSKGINAFSICDFGFWISRLPTDRAWLEQSKIENPQSKMHWLAEKRASRAATGTETQEEDDEDGLTNALGFDGLRQQLKGTPNRIPAFTVCPGIANSQPIQSCAASSSVPD